MSFREPQNSKQEEKRQEGDEKALQPTAPGTWGGGGLFGGLGVRRILRSESVRFVCVGHFFWESSRNPDARRALFQAAGYWVKECRQPEE